jgi:uncharacterized protein (DUF3820 family)
MKKVYFRCYRCNENTNWITKEVVYSNGTIHIKGKCLECGNERLLPRDRERNEYIFYFGKHKGKNITEVPLDYLKWCLDKDVVGGGMAIAIIEILQENNIKVDNYRIR